MAYSSTNALQLIVDPGFGTAIPRVFVYSSTCNSTDIMATGYFSAVGDGGRSTNNVGVRKGDIIWNVSSTNATPNGRATIHSVISSTINQATTAASSAYNFGFDCSVSQSS